MHISAAFDSGNIEVVDLADPRDVRLKIRPDAGGDHLQWFHFRVAGAKGSDLHLRLINASSASYPQAWNDYRAVASTDRITWRRVPTRYDGRELHIEHRPDADLVSYAYFAPYSHERHLDRIGRWQGMPGVGAQVLGCTIDGLDLEGLTVGAGPRRLWIIGRQHPGESMASWWMEGFVDRLLDPDDALARSLRTRATLAIVPCMNPDGVRRGHLRNNAAGANLNRRWHAPSAEESPEVLAVLSEMDRTGVDLCLDVHGDEELPYNFLAGAEGIEGYTDTMRTLQARLLAAYIAANPDMQGEHGYPVDAPGQANLTMCTNQVAQRFDCLALTLEQPFKDTDDAPDPVAGWSPQRARRLGASAVDALAAVVDDLR